MRVNKKSSKLPLLLFVQTARGDAQGLGPNLRHSGNQPPGPNRQGPTEPLWAKRGSAAASCALPCAVIHSSAQCCSLRQLASR